MKVIAYNKYGGPEMLLNQEMDKPHPGDDEVLIKIVAVSINDWDWGLLKGDPFITRLMSGLFTPRKKILGSDVSGLIESIGKNVKQFKPGDEVYGDLSGQWGGFAEYVCAQENRLALKPEKMSFVDAAAIPQAAMLAYQGLCEKGEIQKGKKVLINGAGGGVGTFGIHIARLYDAEVTGVDSSGKLEMLRSIGYHHVIDYAKEDFTRNGQSYDLILDAKTNRSIFDYARALSPGGVYVTVGGSLLRLLQAFILGGLIRKLKRKHIRIVMLKPARDLAYFNRLYEEGKFKPVIDGPYPFEEIRKAFSIFEKGDHLGKMVIII